MEISETVTRGVRVQVRSQFVAERSRPLAGYWFFAYTVQISNEGTEEVQLISRHWRITDANDEIRDVRGPGVVGEQPVLSPGESFEYSSYCPLATPFGTMEGSYQMLTESGETFDAQIAPFVLSEPTTVH